MFKATRTQQACATAAMRQLVNVRADGSTMPAREVYKRSSGDCRAMVRKGRLPLYVAMAYAEIISGLAAVSCKTAQYEQSAGHKIVTMQNRERIDVWLEHGDEGWYVYGEF